MSKQPDHGFASRGGVKLAVALDRFDVALGGRICADLGCSTGGFTDCLLQRGAAHVYAVDTAYGELAWKLRQDPRVTVLERTNALHAAPPEEADGNCDLVTVDLGWTRQHQAIPAALHWLKRDRAARLITLIKPHYESGKHRLEEPQAEQVMREVLASFSPLGVDVLDHMLSPLRGGKGGNLEYLALLKRTE